MRQIAIVLVTTLLAACASSYQLRPDALSLRSSLDEPKALDIVRATFVASGWRSARLDGRRILFKASQEKYAGSRIQNGTLATRYASVTVDAALQLDRLSKVRINPRGGREGVEAQRFAVDVYDSLSNYVAFEGLSPAQLDDFLAALTFLSPDARLISGLGL